MARKNKFIFPLSTEIEVIAIKGKEIIKKEMIYEESLNIKKKKGWIYKTYQLNFSQFNITDLPFNKIED